MRATSYPSRLRFGAFDFGERYGKQWRKVGLERFPDFQFGHVVILVPVEATCIQNIPPRDTRISLAYFWPDPSQASAGFRYDFQHAGGCMESHFNFAKLLEGQSVAESSGAGDAVANVVYALISFLEGIDGIAFGGWPDIVF